MPRALLLVLPLFAAPGCAGEKAPWTGGGHTDAVETGLIDADGDGYYSDEDCNDSDASVRPGVPEVCDGIDNDCNDLVDDGIDVTWYTDADDDGYGDLGAIVQACARPEGTVPNSGDCDDGDADVYPGAAELCDGLDDDCDGEIDEGLGEDTWWYADEDQDGYGDVDSALTACLQPEGYVGNARDCDDADATVYPGAEEVGGDGVVNDCDACWDDGLCELADTPARLLGLTDGDQAGAALAGPGDLDGDGAPDAAVAAPEAAADGADRAGLVYLYAGRWVGDRSLSESEGTLLGPQANARFGLALAGADLDGDGYADVVVGAPGLDVDGTDQGGAWLIRGPVTRELAVSAEDHLEGGADGDGAGAAVAVGGDADGDGVADLLVGAPRWPSLDDYGAAYLVSSEAADGALDADRRYAGGSFGDEAGSAVALGDLDGDGLADLLVGVPRSDRGGRDAGDLRIVLGGGLESGDLSDADGIWVGLSASDGAGAALAVADLDGDGLQDAAVGAADADGAGSGAGGAWVLAGPATGSGTLGDAFAEIIGEDDGCALGAALAPGGDVDGDGAADLLVGEPGCEAGSPDTGSGAVVAGPLSGSSDLSVVAVRWVGESRADDAGTAMAALGDLDGDGRGDLLVGGPGGDGEVAGAGLAWLVLGVGR